MRKITLATLCFMTCLALSLSSIAQSPKYKAAMKKGLAKASELKSVENYQKQAAFFERIANAEKNQWEPYYYAALYQATAAQMNPKNADKIAIKTLELIQSALAIEDNSEIHCVASMIASAQLMVNPMQRWQKFGPISAQELAKAKELDANNPRPYVLEAIGLQNTPESFGGGCESALEKVGEATERFENFKANSEFAPRWGMEICNQVKESCK